MTLKIFALEGETAPPPVHVMLELACDGRSLFCVPPERFACDPWYPSAAHAAHLAGWSMVPGRQLGPCCSGKRS